jgi:hypothetical protein
MQSSLRPQLQDFISEYLIAFLIVIVLFAWAILTQKGSERRPQFAGDVMRLPPLGSVK